MKNFNENLEEEEEEKNHVSSVPPSFSFSSNGISSPSSFLLEQMFTGKRGVQKMINLFDEIRARFPLDKQLKIPSIVVIGDQSHGKSSLLELITGIELPKGEGMVTRMPLELRLRDIKTSREDYQPVYENGHQQDSGTGENENDGNEEEFAEIEECVPLTKENEKDKKSEKIRIKLSQTETFIKEITNKAIKMEQTDNRSVAKNPIILTIYKKNAMDLTLIDLPGIIRNPGENDDPTAPQLIKEMIHRYIEKKETIILNVLQCGDDPQTCESMKISRELDKRWKRTLLVYTKVDKEETETIQSKYKNLRTSYNVPSNHLFFVRNRSYDDIKNKKMLLNKAQEQEQIFFSRRRDHLTEIPESCLGSNKLAEKLHEMLKNAIKKLVPHISDLLNQKKLYLEGRKNILGEELSNADKKTQLIRSFQRVFELLKKSINGESIESLSFLPEQKDENKNDSIKTISSQVYMEFLKFGEEIQNLNTIRSFLDELWFDDLLRRNQEARSIKHLPSIKNPAVTRDIMNDLISKLIHPSNKLVENISGIMQQQTKKIVGSVLQHFPNLHWTILNLFENELKNYEKESKKHVEKMLQFEKNDKFTANNDYYVIVNELERLLFSQTSKTPNTYPTVINIMHKDNQKRQWDGVYVIEGFASDEDTPRYRQFATHENQVTEYCISYHGQWLIAHHSGKTVPPYDEISIAPNNKTNNAMAAINSLENRLQIRVRKDLKDDESGRIIPISYMPLDTWRDKSILQDVTISALEVQNFSNEKRELLKESIRLYSFWCLLKKRFIDYVCKGIAHHLAHVFSDPEIEKKFYNALFEEDWEKLMEEEKTRVDERREIFKALEDVEYCIEKIKEVGKY